MVRYFGPDNGSAYVQLPNGRLAVGRVATVYADPEGTILADILGGTREEQGDPITNVLVDSTGRLNFWFPEDNPVAYVSVNDGPLVRVTADLQDQLDDAIISGGGGGGDVTTAELNAAIASHNADTTGVHGITDTSALETKVGAQSKADTAQGTAISIAASDATSKAAAAVATAASDATAKVAAHASATDPHGDRAYTDANLANKADLVGGVVPSSQLPAIAITEFLGSVANQTAMLALVGQKGDWAIRADTGTTWVITGNNPASIASWTQMPSAGAPVVSVNGQTGAVTLAKGDIGLGAVDNTADVDKPVSTAQQAALNAKAPIASPTFTGTVSGISKGMVGLGNVDNTSDAAKPVSTAQQAALDAKAPLASPAFTGTVTGITKAMVGLANVDNTADVDKPVSTATASALAGKQPLDADLTAIAGLTFTNNDLIQYKAGALTNRTPAQFKTDLELAKSDVGLGNVDNTADSAKPVSAAQQAALDAKADLVGGVIPTAQLPALSITEVFTVASQADMLALTAQRGDVAVRTDVGKTFILSTDSPSTLADWKEVTAIGTVTSVNGQQGVVVLAKSDVGLGNVANALQLVAANNLSDLANATTARANLGVPPATRALTAGTGLTGGGDLSADRSFAVSYGTAAGTAAQGNDTRITGAIQASTGTAKGDLLVFTASGTVARLAVGSNGDHLVADSTQTAGVKWQNARQTQTWAFTGTAAVTTGKARWYNRTGRTLTIVGAWVAANTAPTGATILADVNKNGTTIFTTQANRPSITVSTNGGVLSATPDVTTVADGDYLTVDIDQIGSTIAGADVTVGVVYF